MERSRKIFRKIASASRQVVAAANDYADREDLNGVSRYHFQLEEVMERISVACDCLADILDKRPPAVDGPGVDVRVRDWLITDEPQECLHALSRMESLLQQDPSSWVPRIFRGGRSPTAQQDKMKEAIDHFNSCKIFFHFLFSTEIWNNEKGTQKRQGITQSRNLVVQGEAGCLKPRTAVPPNLGVQRGRAEYLNQGESQVTVQDLPALFHTESATVLERVNQDRLGYVPTQRRHELMTDEQRRERERRFEEILKWLDGLNCAEKQDATLLLRQNDTCKWLLETTQYRMWRDSESGFLWLRGKPGAGKSVLASFVIDSFRKAQREGEMLIFFYCDTRTERSRSPAEVMRSILSQLLRQLHSHSVDLGSIFDDLIKAKGWGGGTLSNAKELAGFASRAAGLLGQKPPVIVDALDECKDFRVLIQALKVIVRHVRLFVTSRPLHVIMDDLLDIPFVSMDDMDDKLSADIKLHVTRELDARQRLRGLDAKLKTEIHSVLCDKADGMFRWVQCSIDTLDRCLTLNQVRNALNSLPKGLDETYERILLAIDTETLAGQLARRALIWLVAALRPLHLCEIMEALSINLRTRTLDAGIKPMHSGVLLDACGSLVTYTQKTGIIILSHSSVKEYLMGEFMRAKLPRYRINLEHAHLLLVRSCMCYISISLKHAQRAAPANIFDSSNTDSSQSSDSFHLKSQPLLDYALDDALDHFGYLGSTFKSALHDVTVLAEDIQQYSWIWDHVCIPARWEIDTKPHWPAARHDLLLYVLIAFAPSSFMRAYCRRIALSPKEGTNPLVYAAHFDKYEHARTLLLRGAGLNHKGWAIGGFCQSLPIEVAFRNHNYGMVALFVEKGSTVPSHIFADSFFGRDRHLDLPSCVPIPSSIARILSQTDDFAENMNNGLNEAALRGMTTSNHLLVFRDATEQDLIAIIRRFIQVVDERFTSIRDAFLRFTVSQGYSSAARYLLSLGIPLPSDILTKLHHLSGRWKTAPMIRFLVDKGADPRARTNYGSVLHATLWAPGGKFYWMASGSDADEGDILEAVELLVDYGCDPLEADSRREDTPFYIAVQRGYISVAQYLINLGASFPPDLFVMLNGQFSGFPVPRTRLTAQKIRFFVDNRADAHAHTGDGLSMLQTALISLDSDNEALEAVKVLIDYGCDPLETNSRGKSPLHIAVAQGYISTARYLTTLGAPLLPDLFATISPIPERWCTPPMIQFLVEGGVNVLAHAGNGDSVLHMALESFNNENEVLESTKLLVGCGCDPLEVNHHGNTPLHIAIEHGYISVARYLLAFGAPFHPDLLVAPSRHRQQWRRARTIRLLIENGASALAHTSDGDSVLHVLLQSLYDDNEALEAVEFLIGHGCNPHGEDGRRSTPLHIAIEHGHVSVAQYLLTLNPSLPPDPLILKRVSNRNPRSPWSTARMIHFLIEHGINIFAQTSSGYSILHIVLRSFSQDSDVSEAVKLLIDHGSDPLKADVCGNTPLRIAVEQGHISAAQYLLDHGAHLPPDLLVTLDSGWTTHMIRFLVEKGANALAHNSEGDSVLQIALNFSYNDNEALEVMKLLVDYGCDPLRPNSLGKTPLHIAVRRGHVHTAQYLLALGAPLKPDLLVTRGDARWATTRMLRFLLGNGVDIRACYGDGDSMLHIALRSNFNNELLEVVKLLVHHGCDPLEPDPPGNTPLHIAVAYGRVSVVRYLLTLDVHIPPELLATLNCNWSHWRVTGSMVRFLVENGIDVLTHTSDGNSVLHIVLRCFYGAEGDILETVKLLVDHGCNPLEANPRGDTPLHIAIQQGYLSIARYLLTRGASLPPDLFFILNRGQSRSRWCTAHTVHFLVENGVNVLAHASNGDSVLHTVLQSSNPNNRGVLEVVELLVGYGCDPLEADSRGNYPLQIAVERGRVSVARYLLSVGSPFPPDLLVTLNSDRPCWSAASMVHFLAENGVNVLAHTDDGDSVLHIALQCFNGDHSILEAVKLLIAHGCDPLEANSHGRTPLHVAIERGYFSAARYLLTLSAEPLPPDLLVTLNCDQSRWSTVPMIHFLVRNGVDVLARASDGGSVLHNALRCFNKDDDMLEVVKFLVSRGCGPLEPNLRGETPLHIAAERSYVSVARYLITQGASIQTKTLNGDTVLHFATSGVYPYPYDDDDDGRALEAVKFFVKCGCETSAANDKGETPLHIAVGLGRIKTIKYLLSLNIPLPTDILFTAIQSDSKSGYYRYIIETLVTSGCDTHTPDVAGVTPLQAAIKKGKVDVVEYLLSVTSANSLPLDDLLSATELAPPSVQSEMKHILSDHRTRSESPDLPPAKRARHM